MPALFEQQTGDLYAQRPAHTAITANRDGQCAEPSFQVAAYTRQTRVNPYYFRL
jgi:hypothetical protein